MEKVVHSKAGYKLRAGNLPCVNAYRSIVHTLIFRKKKNPHLFLKLIWLHSDLVMDTSEQM